MDPANLVVSIGAFIATAGAAAVAWWQAIEASKSRDDARDAEKSALRAWQEASAALIRANDISGVSMRAPLATALNEAATAVIGARATGADDRASLMLLMSRTHNLSEKVFLAGDCPTIEITSWVTYYSRHAELGSPVDPELLAVANLTVRDRLHLWMRDPKAAADLIRADPLVAGFDLA